MTATANPAMPTLVPQAPAPEEAPIDERRLPLLAKAFGVLCVVAGGGAATLLALLIVRLVQNLRNGRIGEGAETMAFALFAIEVALLAAYAVVTVVFGIRLLRNKRRHAAQAADVMIVMTIGVALCEIMAEGFSLNLVPYAVILIFLVAMQSYLDPSLAEERELQRKLRQMQTHDEAESGTLGLDESGKGYIALNFFNLFWIFTVCSVLGLIIETVYHFAVVDPGHYQDRAGLLFGPFSPIYGFGAVLMTVALNRFHNKNVLIIFLVSAVVGGAFEYLTSWFMQFAFGIVAWDYSGTFLSIGGRTNGMFMAMWGLLGVVWIKLLLPGMLKIVNMIPWNWRYAVTVVCAALMIADGAFTLLALDCWYQREADLPQTTAVQGFFDRHFDNQYMEARFQSMSLNPADATRAR